jgi:hypothetical protein
MNILTLISLLKELHGNGFPSLLGKNNYETKLTPEEEKLFQVWKTKYAPNDSGVDYDLRGAFKSGLTPDQSTGHWADTFKKPNHPTFSNQSMYSSFGNPGQWIGENYISPSLKHKTFLDYYLENQGKQ